MHSGLLKCGTNGIQFGCLGQSRREQSTRFSRSPPKLYIHKLRSSKVFHPYLKGSLVRGRILLHAQWSAEMRNQWDSIWLFGTITSRTINILFTQSLRCLFIIVHGTPSTYTLRFCASLSWFDRATAPLLKLFFTIFF